MSLDYERVMAEIKATKEALPEMLAADKKLYASKNPKDYYKLLRGSTGPREN